MFTLFGPHTIICDQKHSSGAPGFWFPERCFWFPWCFFSRNGVFGSREGLVVPRVFSVPGLGCFQFPDSGLMFAGMVCWAPVGVFSSRDGVSGSRPEGTAWRCLWFPYGVSGSRACSSPSSLLLRCFFLLLLASLLSFASFLPSFHLSSFPPLLPCFLSFFFPVLRSCLPPSFPASSCPSFNLPSVLPFLASCPCFLPFLPFLSLPFPSLS